MTLMKLAPEAVRLRRMAKALAAGEISQAEYRAARREVIDNFSALPADDDHTRPRFDAEPTVRGGSPACPEAAHPARSASAVVRVPRRWLWLVGAGLVLAVVLARAPGALAADADVDRVPPVELREANPASSPRLAVRDIELGWGEGEGGTIAGLDFEALQRRADAALAEVRARHVPGDHGFTAAELDEVGRLLKVLGAHDPDSPLDAADARDLSALVREQKHRRGTSVAELEEVAAAVQSALRDQGYFLGAVYLPAQRPRDGVVRLEVLPGRLGDVVVEGGEPGAATAAFAPLLGAPVTLGEVSSRLAALNASPGFTAQASFGPGARVGETRLQLDVLEQRDWLATVTADNHGDSRTGDERLGARAAWLNPRGVGDRLTAGALATFDPANQSYAYLDYDTPVGGGYRLAARIGNNDFTQEGIVDLDGGAVLLDVSARRHLATGHRRSLQLAWSAGRHALDWDDGVDQTVTLAGAGLVGHRVWDRPRLAADLAVNLTVGSVGGDRFLGQDDTFWLLEADSVAWLPLPDSMTGSKLAVRAAGQWGDTLLPATRRFALGGAEAARGFDRGVFLADRGAVLGLEARLPLPLGELVMFADTAYGEAFTADGRRWGRLSDFGFGWEAELSRGIFSRLSLAVPVDAAGTGGIDDNDSRVYWSLRYDR